MQQGHNLAFSSKRPHFWLVVWLVVGKASITYFTSSLPVQEIEGASRELVCSKIPQLGEQVIFLLYSGSWITTWTTDAKNLIDDWNTCTNPFTGTQKLHQKFDFSGLKIKYLDFFLSGGNSTCNSGNKH